MDRKRKRSEVDQGPDSKDHRRPTGPYDLREEWGKWGEWGEWGDELVAEEADNRSDEDLKRQWDKYWLKKEGWKRDKGERARGRNLMDEGDEPDDHLEEEQEVTKLSVMFDDPVPRDAALKALSARMSEYGVVALCDFPEGRTAAVYFIDKGDADRARRDLDGDELEVVESSSVRRHEMNIDRVQQVSLRLPCVIWAGPVLLPGRHHSGIQPTQLAGLFECFGDCVTVVRRTHTVFGLVHARYRFRSDAMGALQALQQRLREDWDILCSFTRRPQGPPRLSHLEDDDLRLHKWFPGKVVQADSMGLRVDIGLPKVIHIPPEEMENCYLGRGVVANPHSGDLVMCQVTGILPEGSGPAAYKFSRRNDFGWPVCFKVLEDIIVSGQWEQGLQVLQHYHLERHSLAFLLIDTLIATGKAGATQCVTALGLAHWFTTAPTNKVQRILDAEQPCERLPLPRGLQAAVEPPKVQVVWPKLPKEDTAGTEPKPLFPSATTAPVAVFPSTVTAAGSLFPSPAPTAAEDHTLDRTATTRFQELQKQRQKQKDDFGAALKDMAEDGNFRHQIAKVCQQKLFHTEWDLTLKALLEETLEADPDVAFEALAQQALLKARRAVPNAVKLDVLAFAMKHAKATLARNLPPRPKLPPVGTEAVPGVASPPASATTGPAVPPVLDMD